LETEGKPRKEAAIEACHLRLRPILMTSFAFGLGVLPLVLAAGAGAEMRFALGVAVFAGMIGVTGFGIFFTPVFFVLIPCLEEKLRGKRGAHPPHSEPAAAASGDGRPPVTEAPGSTADTHGSPAGS